MENEHIKQPLKLNNIFKIASIMGIIVISFSVLFYLTILPLQRDRQKEQKENREKQTQRECVQKLRDECKDKNCDIDNAKKQIEICLMENNF